MSVFFLSSSMVSIQPEYTKVHLLCNLWILMILASSQYRLLHAKKFQGHEDCNSPTVIENVGTITNMLKGFER